MGNRAGQLYRVAGVLRFFVYLSLIVSVVTTCATSAAGTVLGVINTSLFLGLVELATGQPLMVSDQDMQIITGIIYVLMLLPFITVIALHLALLGFARLLDAAGDQALRLQADYETVTDTSYSMWG